MWLNPSKGAEEGKKCFLIGAEKGVTRNQDTQVTSGSCRVTDGQFVKALAPFDLSDCKSISAVWELNGTRSSYKGSCQQLCSRTPGCTAVNVPIDIDKVGSDEFCELFKCQLPISSPRKHSSSNKEVGYYTQEGEV